ncbi:MAG: hypothetical protein GY810_24150 [Aureispira sp.]|nr:hypothetical protein [Aureispira sp.]
MKAKYLLWGACVCAIPFFQTSCTVDKLAEPLGVCDTLTVTYNTHMDTLLNNNCAFSGCHDGASQFPDLRTFGSIGSSNKFDRVHARISEGTMPPSGSLSTDQVQKVQCWKDNNYPEN